MIGHLGFLMIEEDKQVSFLNSIAVYLFSSEMEQACRKLTT
jgi:hypothetical protein